MPTYYIAGPMRGYPDLNFPAFFQCEEDLRQRGFGVVNPARGDDADPDKPLAYYMKRDLPALLGCDGIVLLPSWRDSTGAKLEVEVAHACGLKLYEYAGSGQLLLLARTPACPEEIELRPALVRPAPDYNETILQEADRIVNTDRGNQYGHPLDDFSRAAKVMTGVLLDKLLPGEEVVAEDVPLLLQGVKISREVNRPKRDNRVDGAGYWKTLDMVCTERARREAVA